MYTSIEDLQERMNRNQGPDGEKFGLIKNNKIEAFKVAKHMPHLIQFFNEEIKDNDEVAKAIIDSEPTCIGYLSDRIKNDKKYAEMAIEKDAWAYTSIGEKLRSDKELLIKAAKKNIDILAVIHDSPIINKQDVIIELLEKNKDAIKYIDMESMEKKTIEKILSKNGLLLEYLSDEMKDDKEIVLVAIKNNDEALEYSSPTIQQICKEGEPIKELEKTLKKEKIEKVSNGIDMAFKQVPSLKKGVYIAL